MKQAVQTDLLVCTACNKEINGYEHMQKYNLNITPEKGGDYKFTGTSYLEIAYEEEFI